MAKINITLDLDWFEEDGSLDETLKQKIVDEIVEKIASKEIDNISDTAESMISEQLEKRMNDYMGELFDKPRNITDRWGEVIKENVTIKSQLKEALDNFIDQRVDRNGKASNSAYDSKTRVQYMAEEYYNNYCRDTIEKIARDTTDTIKRMTEQQISTKIGKKMADIIGLSDELGIKLRRPIMDINITIVGMDAAERMIDRLLAVEGQDGEDVERIERQMSDLFAALDGLEESIKRASGMIPPEEGETYYYVDTIYGQVFRAVWRNGKMDRVRARLGDVFQTIEAAYRHVERVRA